MKLVSYLIVVGIFMLVSCKEENVEFRTNDCKGSPRFVRSLAGFDFRKSYFSTSEIRKMGLVLIENNGTANNPDFKYYQHPSWKKGGWLSPIQLDEAGNIYTSPAPFINVLNNPAPEQNTVYKIDAVSGEMNEFIKLPAPDMLPPTNPYGILGLIYYCEGGVLYASSVAGSDRHIERGGIYAVDVKTKKIIDQIGATDALGLGISYITSKRCLYFGAGRNSEVYSVEIAKNGKFLDKPTLVFSIEGLGPRGDDKVRRIRSLPNGNLVIHGFGFNYNLIAPREKPETQYEFTYIPDQEKWICIRIGEPGA